MPTRAERRHFLTQLNLDSDYSRKDVTSSIGQRDNSSSYSRGSSLPEPDVMNIVSEEETDSDEEAEASLPGDEPDPPTKENTLCHPKQLEYLAALDGSDIPALLDKVQKSDAQYAPSVTSSRLQNAPHLDIQGLLFLAGAEIRILKSILTCMLPWEAVHGDTGISRAQVTDRGWSDGPCIYINLIAPKNGRPLSREEMLLCTNAFEHLLIGGIQPHHIDGRSRSSLERGVADAFRKQCPGRELPDIVDYQKAIDMVRNHRTVVDNADPEIIYFPFPGEVGWTKDLTDRMEAHRKFASSPPVFVTMQCLARHLFPHKKIKLHQFALIVLHSAQAAIGESLLSHMCASYLSYGGYNHTNAGISVDWAVTSGDKVWSSYQTRAVYNDFYATMADTLDQVEDLYKERVTQAQERKSCVELRNQIRELKTDNVRKGREVETLQSAEEERVVRLEKLTKKLDRQRKTDWTAELKAFKVADDLQEQLGNALEELDLDAMEGLQLF